MRQIQAHPIRILAALLASAFVFFMLSGIPALRDAKGGLDLALGDVLWLGWMVFALAFLLTGCYTVVRAVRGRRVA